MDDEQIKHMVNRFLQWRLPENFNPDGGISFKKMFNEHTSYPMKHEPVGTNLLDYTQAEEMVRYMVEGMVPPEPAAPPVGAAETPEEFWIRWSVSNHGFAEELIAETWTPLLFAFAAAYRESAKQDKRKQWEAMTPEQQQKHIQETKQVLAELEATPAAPSVGEPDDLPMCNLCNFELPKHRDDCPHGMFPDISDPWELLKAISGRCASGAGEPKQAERAAHELKVWPRYFDALTSGEKTFEVRTADRDYKVGDVLRLNEYDPEGRGFTGRTMDRVVSYMVPVGVQGLPPALVVMSLRQPSAPVGEGAETPKCWHPRVTETGVCPDCSALVVVGADRNEPAPPVGAAEWLRDDERRLLQLEYIYDHLSPYDVRKSDFQWAIHTIKRLTAVYRESASGEQKEKA